VGKGLLKIWWDTKLALSRPVEINEVQMFPATMSSSMVRSDVFLRLELQTLHLKIA
jgi:hypothetical protein